MGPSARLASLAAGELFLVDCSSAEEQVYNLDEAELAQELPLDRNPTRMDFHKLAKGNLVGFGHSGCTGLGSTD